ncbi:MAG: Fe-S cluster assembly protein SufD [Pyrinomonadaceae bacterium]|nr:Fe-S cluster assembly protein SufD [Pyrinomonadaceae bacterium]
MQAAKEVTKEASNYVAAFQERTESQKTDVPAWVEDLRRRAIEQFEAVGFPVTDVEDYKYTNVAAIARGNFQPTFEAQANGLLDKNALERFTYPESKGSTLAFVNGILAPELSAIENLPDGVVVTELREALGGEYADLVRGYLARGAEASGDDAFTSLNTAFLSSGAFLLFRRNVQVEQPIHLLFLSASTDTAKPIAAFPRVLVIAETGSEATVIEDHTGINDEEVYFSSPVVEIYVDDEAQLTHYKVQRESLGAFHVAQTRAEVGRGSRYDSTSITLGAALARHNINMQLRGEGSESWVDGLYIVGTGQHADTHSLINHRMPHCVSHQSYKGILDGKSRGVFNGRIFVHKGAQQTDAYQSNKNLMLSNDARVDTKPQLEIFADDVKCSHGATVGQLNEEELFYLTSRGLRPELARNLLTYGFAEAIVQKIKVESIKSQLDEAILNRLHARLEV